MFIRYFSIISSFSTLLSHSKSLTTVTIQNAAINHSKIFPFPLLDRQTVKPDTILGDHGAGIEKTTSYRHSDESLMFSVENRFTHSNIGNKSVMYTLTCP